MLRKFVWIYIRTDRQDRDCNQAPPFTNWGYDINRYVNYAKWLQFLTINDAAMTGVSVCLSESCLFCWLSWYLTDLALCVNIWLVLVKVFMFDDLIFKQESRVEIYYFPKMRRGFMECVPGLRFPLNLPICWFFVHKIHINTLNNIAPRSVRRKTIFIPPLNLNPGSAPWNLLYSF